MASDEKRYIQLLQNVSLPIAKTNIYFLYFLLIQVKISKEKQILLQPNINVLTKTIIIILISKKEL